LAGALDQYRLPGKESFLLNCPAYTEWIFKDIELMEFPCAFSCIERRGGNWNGSVVKMPIRKTHPLFVVWPSTSLSPSPRPRPQYYKRRLTKSLSWRPIEGQSPPTAPVLPILYILPVRTVQTVPAVLTVPTVSVAPPPQTPSTVFTLPEPPVWQPAPV
jgi:hypothetical protein